jgi:hypothetical protein
MACLVPSISKMPVRTGKPRWTSSVMPLGLCKTKKIGERFKSKKTMPTQIPTNQSHHHNNRHDKQDQTSEESMYARIANFGHLLVDAFGIFLDVFVVVELVV